MSPAESGSVLKFVPRRDILLCGMELPVPRIWEDIAMRFSSLFVASPAVAILSIALLLCGPSGTTMSQAATPSSDATTSLPSVVVARPHQLKHLAVARDTVSPQTSPTTPTPSSTSTMVQLAKYASRTGSCVGGCVTSFRSGNAPWLGCSGYSGIYSLTCRNVANFKTYGECKEAGLLTGWRNNEVSWYCTSLALK